MRTFKLLQYFLHADSEALSIKVFASSSVVINICALMLENLSLGFANYKGADQPAHLNSLLSAFNNQVLESTISNFVK